MLCQERIDARLSDAESLVRSGADIGDPHTFLRSLWTQVYDQAPMHLRSAALRRLHALARHLGVGYEHGSDVEPPR
ncbi:hypothetical protein [Pseudoxanthomonas sp. PXM02]|uniref:hypothetical protein n=1 Tax=Pseudoxanthomonas sp. PXM02 TaxID=2769294 RepID=UPI00177FBBA8|nr:hypothetical protein [Pseudoxanthomonas sp. PXM02]MBD9478098.1 hypothetical protein [Pseudoxanthomonas sp. PXM02]